MKYLYIILAFTPILLQGQSIERSVISNAGNIFTTDQLSMDFTIGESVISTFNTGETVMTQGFHQTDLITTSTANINGVKIKIKAFPNPFVDQLTVDFTQGLGDHFLVDDLHLKIYNIVGKAVIMKAINSPRFTINTGNFPVGMYYLEIKYGHQHITRIPLIKAAF